jgi:hypothetical protein
MNFEGRETLWFRPISRYNPENPENPVGTDNIDEHLSTTAMMWSKFKSVSQNESKR